MVNKLHNNIILFALFVAIIVSLPIICVDKYLSRPDSPWQLQPFNADSLSIFYKEHYQILENEPLVRYLIDTTKVTVLVLVDGWGVPYKEIQLVRDFSFFETISLELAIHRRDFNITKIVEQEELLWGDSTGIFLYNADSAECNKKRNYLEPYYSEQVCCANCTDLETSYMLDSLLSIGVWKKFAWTTRQTREGNRKILRQLLQRLADITKKHPNIQFIIQGTHRPTLGSPETRREYLAPWVPAVFMNCTIID